MHAALGASSTPARIFLFELHESPDYRNGQVSILLLGLNRGITAGAFGAHIDVKYAMVLGMIPDCELEHVTSAGNAAGTGATITLLDKDARSEIEDVVKRIQKIETAVEQKFQDHFVEALAIPHKTAEYPLLKKEVNIPAPSFGASDDDQGGRSRRRRRRA